MDLRNFKAMNKVTEPSAYISALEAFDGIEELQDLKRLARERGGIAPGKTVLDAGCGFGLETLRLAETVAPSGKVHGLDKSEDFISEARKRAEAAGAEIDYRTGDATDLPFEDKLFDCVRCERMLMYLTEFESAVAEMKRVLRPGGRLALIEADFSTNTVNIANRPLVRKVLDHEILTAVNHNWLPGPLFAALTELGFQNIEISSRALIFPQELALTYFTGVGAKAHDARIISQKELDEWQSALDELHAAGTLFATVSYFLFTASHP